MQINSFYGIRRFLSNFYPCRVGVEGNTWRFLSGGKYYGNSLYKNLR